ncbi:hypothetical protein NY10_989 [Carnobacterium antarcticum]|nr:hypothetical protein NY10_989 [Carnobacterium sp. CP1]
MLHVLHGITPRLLLIREYHFLINFSFQQLHMDSQMLKFK